MSIGPLMVDVEGLALDDGDRKLLSSPAVGGVILFSRNYESSEQLKALCAAIRAVRTPPLLIAVDQEGGRIQRFREGFTALPAARTIGREYDLDKARGRDLARAAGYVMARELIEHGVDISFAPVLDIDRGVSEVIGDRAYHSTLQGIGDLAQSTMNGMRSAGMQAVGKHFPGHGGVAVDSHVALPVDKRMVEDLGDDMKPFERLFRAGLAAIMTAHVLYPDVDAVPASLSSRWLQDILRRQLGFSGAVFSDDLSMGGVADAGGPLDRARDALEAGCDMVLVCNDRDAALEVATGLAEVVMPTSRVRLARLRARATEAAQPSKDVLQGPSARELLASLSRPPLFDFEDQS